MELFLDVRKLITFVDKRPKREGRKKLIANMGPHTLGCFRHFKFVQPIERKRSRISHGYNKKNRSRISPETTKNYFKSFLHLCSIFCGYSSLARPLFLSERWPPESQACDKGDRTPANLREQTANPTGICFLALSTLSGSF